MRIELKFGISEKGTVLFLEIKVEKGDRLLFD